MPACPHCSRLNPDVALFCFHDGGPLGSVSPGESGRFRFVAPFVFPSGRACWTFDELALACQDDWQPAVELLLSGALPAFLGGIGRPDLAAAASEAARFPDPDRALDRFLGELPTSVLRPAKLAFSPLEIDLGRLRVGHNVRRELHLVNEGMGLLHGTISSDVPWLVVGEADGLPSKLFGCLNETTILVQVRGRALRASLQPQLGRLTIRSSGGSADIVVKAEVSPQTFAAGVLAGARSPRQLAEKARLAPRESARLFESGAVARWYQENGWSYPVEGESVAGLAAVQQFFDALGLSAPPKLELSEPAVALAGLAGESVRHTLELSASEKRPVYARAVSDQRWLVVSGVDLEGSNAHIHLSVPAIPDRGGETLWATLRITANSRQQITVPVSLRVAPAACRQPVLTSAHASTHAAKNGELDWLPFDGGQNPSPLPPPRSGEGVEDNPSPLPPPRSGEGAEDNPSPLPPPRSGEGVEDRRQPLRSPSPLPAPTSPLRGGGLGGRGSALASPAPDWLLAPALPPLPEEPCAAVLTPVRQRRIPRALWLALFPVGLLLVLAIAGVIIAANRAGPTVPVEDAEETTTAGPLPLNQPEQKPPTEKSTRANHSPPVEMPTTPGKPPQQSVAPPSARPPVLAVPELVSRNVEVVFCIDTTGSMGGLLAGARSKIWAICNQIASGKPVPRLKVGLLAYRDRGDEYITRVYDLRNDLDAVQSDLNTLVAAGGGDIPESVNQALDDAVNKIRWSTDKRTLRIIFLVGDAPPHMDYPDDVKYPITCKKAVEKSILINTVQCGNDDDCKRYWKDIAGKSGGEYVVIPQTGGVVALTTPFDGDLAYIGEELLKTALIHGDAATKAKGARMLAAARALKGPAAADRAAFCGKNKEIGPYDLLDSIKAKRVKLNDVKDDELPDSMKRLRTIKARQSYLDRVAGRRAELYKKAMALEMKRAAALAARKGDRESFDLKVLEVLRKQAKKFDIDY